MSQFEHDGLCRLQVEDGVATITLNRPEAMNAINGALSSGLWAAMTLASSACTAASRSAMGAVGLVGI